MPKRPVTAREVEPLLIAASRAGLAIPREDEEEARRTGSLSVHAAGRPISFGVRYRAGAPDGWVIHARAEERIAARLVFRPAWLWPAGRRRGRAHSGDHAFDRLVEAYGPAPVVSALLSFEARASLRELAGEVRFETLELRDHEAIWRATPGFDARPTQLEGVLTRLLRLTTSHWLSEGQVEERLLHSATSDPEEPVRAKTSAILLDLLHDGEHRSSLRTYRTLVTSPRVPRVHRLTALVRLRELPADKVTPIMELVLHQGDPLASVAVAYFTSIAQAPDLDLAVRVAKNGDEALAVAVVHMLGVAATREDRRASVEAPLIELLAHRSVDVRTAAAKILRDVGTARSIAPLEGAVRRWLPERALRRAVEDALEAIRARGVDTEPGRLSLADDEGAGRVSLTDGPGDVSLAKRHE